MTKKKILQPGSYNTPSAKTRCPLFKKALGDSSRVQDKLNPRKGKGATFARIEAENVPALLQAELAPPKKQTSSSKSTRAKRNADHPRLHLVRRPTPPRNNRLKAHIERHKAERTGLRDGVENLCMPNATNGARVKPKAALVLRKTQDKNSEGVAEQVGKRDLNTSASQGSTIPRATRKRKRGEVGSVSRLFSHG